MSKKVALMCGHGTMTNGVWDPGTTYGKYAEAGLMLPITYSAVKYLRAQGVKVISDADYANKRNMTVDVAWANKWGADIYVSVHCDYYKASTGVYPLYVSKKGKKLAKALNKVIKKGIPMKSRGVCKRTDLYELNATDMPACVLETGSIKADLDILKDYDKYGKLIAKGICNYLGVTFDANAQTVEAPVKEPAKTEPVKTETKKKNNAEKIKAKAKRFSYPKGTKYSIYSYKKGSPKATYKKALEKWLGKTAKISRSDCGYFVSTCVRASGVSKKFLALKGNKDPFPAVPKTMRIVHEGRKVPKGLLQPGDIIRYKKKGGSQHTLMYYRDGVIAEAQRGTTFPARKKDKKKYNAANVKKKTLQVIRAK